MFNSWQQLCRLCAKENGSEVDVFLKSENGDSLAEAIQKYFLITISPYEQSPTMICTTCYKSITNLVLFAEHTFKVEAFFTKLMLNEFNMMAIDLNNLKFEHGLSEFVFSFPDVIQKRDQGSDTNDLMNNNSTYPKEYSNMNHKNQEIIPADVTIKNGSDSDEKSFPTTRKRVKRRTQKELYEQHTKNDSTEKQLKNEANKIEPTTFTESHNNTKKESISEDENFSEMKDESTSASESAESEPKPVKKRPKRTKGTPRNTNPKQSFQCDNCNRCFKTDYNFQQHTKKCHSPAEKKIYTCEKCAKQFSSRDGIRQHEAVHLPDELKYTHACLYCDKKFSVFRYVQAHIKAVHIGDKSFVCEECGKAFKTNGALKEHKYVHVQETPFECPKCSKKFKTMLLLKIHEDTHNDTVYACPECDVKLNTKRTLNVHMRIHSDKKMYKCDYCSNEYKRIGTLKSHLILHTGLKPYTCPFCDKTFANGSNCRKHKKLSHPVELAAMEAAGEIHLQTKIPKIAQLRAVVSNLL